MLVISEVYCFTRRTGIYFSPSWPGLVQLNRPLERGRSAQPLGHVLHVELGESMQGDRIQILVVAIPFTDDVEFVEVAATHLMHVVLERFDHLMLFCPGHRSRFQTNWRRELLTAW